MLYKLFKSENEKTSLEVNDDRNGGSWKRLRTTSLLAALMLVETWSLAGGFLSANAQDICILRQKSVSPGDWRTLESFWNAKATAFFREPTGAQIKVRYATFIGYDSQKQTLDGYNYKKLSVSSGSLVYARMQIKVSSNTNLVYLVCPGGVAVNSPTIRF
ncbi:MAG TPA: hypothetical protein DCE56_06875 [Cyanobacteria bacterium UBA8553]|nr:hypothetical protein [Cyanobacteria bacterium UBA8553]HAJ63021.1 hypothetical protein [Cyanobacteria bacterium UBA8543]